MGNLPFRQVHLDFHTSEMIDGIGEDFSKEQFQEMLKKGHVNSINLFSKCHHGWAYHPTKANEIHPHLEFDLLGNMLEAAAEINVRTQIYLSAGIDEKMARVHPEWLIRNRDESTTWVKDFMVPGYHLHCFNTPYLDYFLNQIKEVIQKYETEGIWLDIVGVKSCYCQNCIAGAREMGLDINDESQMMILWEKTYSNYTAGVQAVVDEFKPGLRIFHNGGHIRRGRRDIADMNTHIELESLPTGEWGYDHFPLSVRYVQNLGMECLGMTGKFHTQWGEFGGYKHPNALRYETSLALANGAKCCIGDQLHPRGVMDEATYRLIGSAYREVELKEEWCDDVESVADMGLLSLEAMGVEKSGEAQAGWTGKTDTGAVRILLEGNYLFDVIDAVSNFKKYKLIVLPDKIRLNKTLTSKLEEYILQGGKILATGESGLDLEKDEFVLDLGVKYICKNPYQPDYFKPDFELKSLYQASFVFYGEGEQVELDGGTVLGYRENPYFNREVFNFCSHRHTPSAMEKSGPGMVENQNGIYIPWKVFEDYATKGSLPLKETVQYAIDKLLEGEKVLETALQSQGIVTLMRQSGENRYVQHNLYANHVKRGDDIEVIEEIYPIYKVKVTIRIPEKVKRVYLAPENSDIEFEQSNNQVSYVIPEVQCHQMVVLDY